MKRTAFCSLMTLLLSLICFADEKTDAGDGWISLFNGKTLDGWKVSGHEGSFQVRDRMIVAHVPSSPCAVAHMCGISHLFYVGEINDGVFKNFEFKADVMTKPNSNGGIFFGADPAGEPISFDLVAKSIAAVGSLARGCEVQVNNTYIIDKRKTGSLYRVQDNLEAPVQDNTWFTMHIVVHDPHVMIKVNDRTIVDWTKPEGWRGIRGADPGYGGPNCELGAGTFALQAHDSQSVVHYKKLRVKPLP